MILNPALNISYVIRTFPKRTEAYIPRRDKPLRGGNLHCILKNIRMNVYGSRIKTSEDGDQVLKAGTVLEKRILDRLDDIEIYAFYYVAGIKIEEEEEESLANRGRGVGNFSSPHENVRIMNDVDEMAGPRNIHQHRVLTIARACGVRSTHYHQEAESIP